MPTTRFHAAPIRTDNGYLRKFGATNPHGTGFALRQCLYQNKDTGMERLKMHSLCRCKQRTRRYERANDTRFHAVPYKANNGNLGKFVATNPHGTVFALRQCVYEKEAIGTERINIPSL